MPNADQMAPKKNTPDKQMSGGSNRFGTLTVPQIQILGDSHIQLWLLPIPPSRGEMYNSYVLNQT